MYHNCFGFIFNELFVCVKFGHLKKIDVNIESSKNATTTVICSVHQ